MKITISSRDLAEALAFVTRMSPKRPTQPILSGVLIKATTNQVNLSVFDYERAAETALAADVAEEGVALVHAITLQQWVSKLPRKDVVLETGEAALQLRCGSVRMSLPLMPAGEFPSPKFEAEVLASMSGAIFEDAMSRVAIAASSDDVTPIIGGVHTMVTDGAVTFAATDRYRVAHLSMQCETGAEGDFTIPALVLREAAKALGSSELVTLGVTESGAVSLRGERGAILTNVITGKFPPVARLFPSEPRAVAVVDRELITEATLRGALAVEALGAVKFTFSNDGCRIGGASEGKDIAEEFDVEFSDEELSIALRPQFAVEGFSACHAEKLTVWFTHSASDSKPGPVMFTGGDSFRYLLQPNLLLK